MTRDAELLLQTLATLFVSVSSRVFPAQSVGCFMCSSYNNSDPSCHDPFNPVETGIYHKDCKTTVPGRNGLFPAHFCVKMSGTSVSTGTRVIVRTCSTQNMGHQCGFFEFERNKYRGCLTTCTLLGCNQGASLNNAFHPYLCGLMTMLFNVFVCGAVR